MTRTLTVVFTYPESQLQTMNLHVFTLWEEKTHTDKGSASKLHDFDFTYSSIYHTAVKRINDTFVIVYLLFKQFKWNTQAK